MAPLIINITRMYYRNKCNFHCLKAGQVFRLSNDVDSIGFCLKRVHKYKYENIIILLSEYFYPRYIILYYFKKYFSFSFHSYLKMHICKLRISFIVQMTLNTHKY